MLRRLNIDQKQLIIDLGTILSQHYTNYCVYESQQNDLPYLQAHFRQSASYFISFKEREPDEAMKYYEARLTQAGVLTNFHSLSRDPAAIDTLPPEVVNAAKRQGLRLPAVCLEKELPENCWISGKNPMIEQAYSKLSSVLRRASDDVENIRALE